MKRILITILLFLGFVSVAQAQNPATVTGHAIFPSSGAAQNASVCFTLQNFKPNIPRVTSTGVIVEQQNWCITPSTVDGSFSTPVLRNDFISPGGTFWRVDWLWNGIQQSSATFIINHTPFNLDTEIPLSSTPTAGPNQVVTQAFSCPQPNASTTWTCTHNFNDTNVEVQTYDATGKVIYPDTVTSTNSNTVTITFLVAQAGLAVVFHAGSISIATSQPNAVLQNPTGTQSICCFSLNDSAPTTFSGTTTIGVATIIAKTTDNIQTLINSLPASGGTVYIPPGSYLGPTTIPNHTTLICLSWMACTFTYTSSLNIGVNGGVANYFSVNLKDIVFDFGNNAGAGFVLNDVLYSQFSMTINNTNGSGAVGLTVKGTCAIPGNPATCVNNPWPSSASAFNEFDYLHIDNSNEPLVLNGDDNLASCGGTQQIGGASFFNRFRRLILTNVKNADAIRFTSGTDSNEFDHLYMQLSTAPASVNGIVLGSRCPTSYGDIDINHFGYVSMDTPASWTGNAVVGNFSRTFFDDIYGSPQSRIFSNNGFAQFMFGSVSGGVGLNNLSSNPGFTMSGDTQLLAGLAATSGANRTSPHLCLGGNQWTGSTSSLSTWCFSTSQNSSGVPTFENLVLQQSNGVSLTNRTFSLANGMRLGLGHSDGTNGLFTTLDSPGNNYTWTVPTATGNVVLDTVPVINAPATGSGIQGTDSKLLTSGTISGTGSGLCTDANGGATTTGCGGTIPTFTTKTLVSNVAVSATTVTTIDSIALSALPAYCGTNGCRLRVSYSYFVNGGTFGLSWVDDGTNTYAQAMCGTLNNNFSICSTSMLSPTQFSSGAAPTVAIKFIDNGSATACTNLSGAASPCTNAPTNTPSIPSRMSIEVVSSQ